MNTIKKIFMISAITSLMVACSSDDDKSTTEELDGVITSLTDPDYKANDLKGIIGANIELPVGEYKLTGGLVVRSPYTLKLNPGTVIKASAGLSGTSTGIYLIVDQGAKLDAVGTASAPITFTSDAATPAPGNWGGIILCGSAPISRPSTISDAAAANYTAVTEVVNHFYGGNVVADNSGHLEYVKILYSGAKINDSKEFNGLTLYAVGNGTIIKNIAIFNGSDDAIEFFGGTVNVENILAVNADDDMFDWTQGWNGHAKNFYGIREAGFGDPTSPDPRGIEADGNFDGLNPAWIVQSNPTLEDFTIINNSTVMTLSDAIKLRRNTGVTITNTKLVWGAGVASTDLVDLTDAAGDGNGSLINVSISVEGALTAGAIKKGTGIGMPATINVAAGATGASTAAFAWTGYTF